MSYIVQKGLVLLVIAFSLSGRAQQIAVYPLGKFDLEKEVTQVAIANDALLTAAIDKKGLLLLWDIQNLNVKAKKETGLKPIYLSFMRDDDQVIVIDRGGDAFIYDLNLELKQSFEFGVIQLPGLDPERKLITFIRDDAVVVYNPGSGLPQHTIQLKDRMKEPAYLGFDQFGNQLFLVDKLGTALTIDPIRQQVLSEFRIRSDEIDNSASVLHSVSVNSAANYFVAGAQEVFIPKGGLAANTQPQRRNSLIAFDGTTKSEIKRIRVNDRLDYLQIGPELHNVTGFTENKFDVTIYDIINGMEVARVTPPDIPVSVNLSAGGQYLAVGTDRGNTIVYELVRQSAPQIEIQSPAINRNIGENVMKENSVEVKGTIANTRMKELYINSEALEIGVSNSFQKRVDLIPGKNRINISGTDFDNNLLTKEIYVTYEPEKVINSVGPSALNTQKRVALVIGNADYESNAKLNNTRNDAVLMTETLKSLGFEVTTILDGSYEEMKNAVLAFGSKIQNVDVSIYYYAGHGLEVEGVNYLVPVDAHIENALDVQQKTLPLTSVIRMGQYANRQGLNMIILDACRNNPFPTGQRGGAGLAKENAPSGTLIAYATSPGSVASDGTGKNGLYTSQLAEQMKIPQRIEDIFIKTRNNVEQLSGGTQQPWEEARLNGVFYLAFD